MVCFGTYSAQHLQDGPSAYPAHTFLRGRASQVCTVGPNLYAAVRE
jgi:hypothetical protein